jgi:hypothetical protein
MQTIAEVACEIERQIYRKTHGRVRGLRVDVAEDSVTLRGEASTYYAKQIAQHVVLDMLVGQPVVNAIEVA